MSVAQDFVTEEIAALAAYLASDDSSFTTGSAQIGDGRRSNRHPDRRRL